MTSICISYRIFARLFVQNPLFLCKQHFLCKADRTQKCADYGGAVSPEREKALMTVAQQLSALRVVDNKGLRCVIAMKKGAR